MRILVISDTHGYVSPAMEIYRNQHEIEPIDCIVHLGDLVSDARALKARLHAEVISVKGNMDGSHSEEDYKILTTEYGNLLLCHGHMQNVKYDTQNLLYRAEELGCKAALYGHTHIPSFVDANGIYLLNPGSLSLPKGGNPGSYAMIETSSEEFRATILFEPPKKPKVTGGYLRDLLNNSDRA
ncbi:metallophosphoesterase [Sinanaerobacter sp. ZZT-01]|uniref:metallophosphoesterase n=1 Tax=Sinanaerobacter sp. ZZT-01 TaxID=3111540 RepID=UPI002D781E1C|nr:metallophosphoesterase [Sinanaerobacter sp. ZZT-01]WRR95029.1 metallophosphoesterase [Sinanaerobacter sp. ZZT-01]